MLNFIHDKIRKYSNKIYRITTDRRINILSYKNKRMLPTTIYEYDVLLGRENVSGWTDIQI